MRGEADEIQGMLRGHGERPQQLLQDGCGGHLHADERGSYAQRPAETGIQRTDSRRELLHHPQPCQQRPDGLQHPDPSAGEA